MLGSVMRITKLVLPDNLQLPLEDEPASESLLLLISILLLIILVD